MWNQHIRIWDASVGLHVKEDDKLVLCPRIIDEIQQKHRLPDAATADNQLVPASARFLK